MEQYLITSVAAAAHKICKGRKRRTHKRSILFFCPGSLNEYKRVRRPTSPAFRDGDVMIPVILVPDPESEKKCSKIGTNLNLKNPGLESYHVN